MSLSGNGKGALTAPTAKDAIEDGERDIELGQAPNSTPELKRVPGLPHASGADQMLEAQPHPLGRDSVGGTQTDERII